MTEWKIENTANKLPENEKSVLFWYGGGWSYWAVGIFYKGVGQLGDFFTQHGGPAWYLCDGHVDWTELPPRRKK